LARAQLVIRYGKVISLEDILMAEPLVSDALWQRIEPLLPAPKPRRFRFPGRKPLDRRKVLTGIIFVLRTGIPWELLPQEMGCGCGMSCLNYLKAWHDAGVWPKLQTLLLAELREADKIDWSRATVDSSSVRALGGGEETGPNPTDRRKLGSKHHVCTDAQGIPLATTVTAANVHDVKQLLPVVDAVPPIAGKAGAPRRRPKKLYADRAYDSDPHRQQLRHRGIKPQIARRRTEHGSGLGIYRWVAERTQSWLHQFRRLRLRTDRRAGIHQAFMTLASALICVSFL
jgi:transposase